MKSLAGKVAIVMGATREGNMGQAIARRFLDEGANVVVSGRSAAGLDAFASATGAMAIPADVSNREAVSALFQNVQERFGQVDIAVNAAATAQYGPFEEMTEAEIDEMLAIIFKGGIWFMQAAIGAMKASGGGAIVNVSSAVADIMFENHVAYMGAKAGLNHMTRAVANEFGQFGIRANILSPGLTETPMLGGSFTPAMIDAFAREYPLGRITTVDDVANAALFMAGDECFMTGQTFHVTGGLTLRRNPTAAEIMRAATGQN
ncbi:SDR family NAD(P)-dependent oxidoreductase [Novosphingobium taihuense]|uniref:NAD(P)-dependent dehydrogenase (Short-subunit alcohol dehydrogenase family) n=1 Tax=Novosphingobium taihuense TaxID=260085 RepID=A0A7W7ADQ1_9SPHN|nr:SDR family oxidoreductase [Novosphingobium taihuense]MBB4615006.1 NAD(P)-dependent dehydrogenase (short-subunit alcohol dehydrogenase family) [Novosphingobium taihuense]TWH84553.1 NAD(P)-dependent dehydrogenase (short-subunit alcohol dehydrogenase family) [Novosphingobium taihuense]